MGKEVTISVAFADDHQILIEGLASIFSAKDDLTVVGLGYCADDALRIVEEKCPDVIVLDLSMPGNVHATIRDIALGYPLTKIVVFSASADLITAVELMELGVAAYVIKGGSSAELHYAIRKAYAGETYLSRRPLQKKNVTLH